jgi:uncharacterized membrane protein YfcA
MKPTCGFLVMALPWLAHAQSILAQKGLLAESDSTDKYIHHLQSSLRNDDGATSTSARWLAVGDQAADHLDQNGTTVEDMDEPIQTPFSPNSSEESDGPFVPRLFPLTGSDYVGFACATLGLMIAAGGGIGGGGILVPIYLLLVKLPVKYAISTTSVTVLGGGIANVLLNSFKRHPVHKDRSSVDWVLTLLVEPTQMGGTLIGTMLHDYLPDLLVVVLLLALLSLTACRTIDKANQLHAKETRSMARVAPEVRRSSTGTPDPESQQLLRGPGTEAGGPTTYKAVELSKAPSSNLEHDTPIDEYADAVEIAKLTVLFAVITALNLLKGSSSTRSSNAWLFWTAQAVMLLVIVCFVAWERALILSRRHQGRAIHSDIEWDERSTIRYPFLSTAAGVVAGLFGIGGGIVMGPLMLEMGVPAQVAAATSAAMILYTSATASFGYLCFGRLLPDYSLVGLLLGFGATLIGQTAMSVLLHRYQRPSYIAYCIGTVVAISAVCMSLEGLLAMLQAISQ